jgi:hypothetical protein
VTQTGSADQREGAASAHSRHQFRIARGFGCDGRLLDQFIAAFGLGFEFEVGRHDVEDVTGNLEQVSGVTVPEFKFDLRNRTRGVGMSVPSPLR